MFPKDSINAVLAALQHGETSLIVTIEPDQIPNAMNALSAYRKLFAPFIPGVTDTAPIDAAFERMRQAEMIRPTILLFVECQTMASSIRLSAACRFGKLPSGGLLTIQSFGSATLAAETNRCVRPSKGTLRRKT